jgi:hypothetical protein
MDVNLRERYPMPVFESSPVARIPYTSPRAFAVAAAGEGAGGKVSRASDGRTEDLTGISADG